MHAKPPFNISRTRVCVLINISSMAEMKYVRYNMNNVSLTKTSTSKSCTCTRYADNDEICFFGNTCTSPKLWTKYKTKITLQLLYCNLLVFF